LRLGVFAVQKLNDTTWQIEDFLTVRDGRLFIDGHDAVALAREYGTPLFVFSEPRIRHNIDRLKESRRIYRLPAKALLCGQGDVHDGYFAGSERCRQRP
jgi:hypothetical protein